MQFYSLGQNTNFPHVSRNLNLIPFFATPPQAHAVGGLNLFPALFMVYLEPLKVHMVFVFMYFRRHTKHLVQD